ncbi:MAG: AMP-binding protein, partial [Bradyrhizobium sp.]
MIGLPVAARDELSRAIPGMASNVLPLRLSLRSDMSVAEVIAQVSARIREGSPHQRYQLAEIRRGAAREALFGLSINVMPFDYGFTFAGHRAAAHNLSLGPVEDLSISVYDRSDDGALRVDFDVNPARHSASDLAMHRQRFLRLLSALGDAACPIGNLAILNDIERNTILTRWNETASPLPRANFPGLFAAQAARTPQAAAVIFGERQLSYAALDVAANQLANHLRTLGVGPETVVGLCLERSPEMLIGLLGILKAGGAYLPLDASYPRGRLEFMLADAGVAVLVTDTSLADRIPAATSAIAIVRLDGEAAMIAGCPATAPNVSINPHHAAYVIYTSGSSGTPKAVVVEHRSLTNKMLALGRDFAVDARFRAALLISSAFDPSIEQALLPLIGGG